MTTPTTPAATPLQLPPTATTTPAGPRSRSNAVAGRSNRRSNRRRPRRGRAPASRRRRPAVVGAMMLIGGGIIAMFAIMGLAVSFGAVIDQTFMNLAFTTPDFDYELGPDGETGNATFEVYAMMRTIAGGLIGIVLILGGLSRVFESADVGLVQTGTASRLFSKSVLFFIVIMVFPPIWDGLSDAGDALALWIVNPLYSFDDDRPCPDSFYADPDGVWAREYMTSPYILWADKQEGGPPADPGRQGAGAGGAGGGGGGGGRELRDSGRGYEKWEKLCRPELRVNYVFGQMLRNTEVSQLRDEFGMPAVNATSTAWMDSVSTDIWAGLSGGLTNLFLGLTKALVAIQVLILTVLFGVMTDMLVHMVIAGLPVFLVLSVMPYCGATFQKFVEAVPALLLLPIMSAVIISVGAAAIVEAPSAADGSPYTDPAAWTTVPDGGAGETAATAAGSAMDHVYVWITALGVVFFAITLPVLMVPMIGSSLQMAQNVVSSAISTSGIVAGSAASSAASSVAHSRGLRDVGTLGTLGRAAMAAGTGGVMSMGSVGMPSVGGVDIGAGRMADSITSTEKSMHPTASAATAGKVSAFFDQSAAATATPGSVRGMFDGFSDVENAPRFSKNMSPDDRAAMMRGFLTTPGWENPVADGNPVQGAGYEEQQRLALGNEKSALYDPDMARNYANTVGHEHARLANPEISRSGMNEHVNDFMRENPGSNRDEVRQQFVDRAMEMRGMDPKDAGDRKAFQNTLKTNDAAIKARGGPGYQHGQWWTAV